MVLPTESVDNRAEKPNDLFLSTAFPNSITGYCTEKRADRGLLFVVSMVQFIAETC